MEQSSEVGETGIQADKYAVIADEIRSLSQDLTDSLLKVLIELGKSNWGNVYVASKKFVEEKGLLLADEGYVGISDRFVRGENDEYLVCPADIVIYAGTRRLKTEDVLLAFYFEKSSFWFYHCKVLRFDPRGGVEVRDLIDDKAYWISSEKIFGKLAKVIHFNDPEWHELVGQMVDRKFLVNSLTKHSKQLEARGPPDTSRRLDELKRRIAILTADQP